MNDIVVLAEKNGLTLATPVRTLHVETMPKELLKPATTEKTA